MIEARVSIFEGSTAVVLVQDRHGRRLLGDTDRDDCDIEILNKALDLVLKAYKGGE